MKISDTHIQAIQELCDIIDDWATRKGWNEVPDSVSRKAEQIALMHSELSECLEFLRKNGVEECPHCPSRLTEHRGLDLDDGHIWLCPMCGREHVGKAPDQVPQMDDHVPELTGEEAELADLLIRVFHYCGNRNINLGRAIALKQNYNENRPYKHGKKI